jgi:hypothetical protein
MLHILLLIPIVLSFCNQTTIYREWRELSLAEQKGYVEAIVCLRKKPNLIKIKRKKFLFIPLESKVKLESRYDDFVYSHAKAAPIMVPFE